MADQPRIRVPVDFPGAETAAALSARLDELNADGLKAAEALSKGEVSAKDYAAGQRTAAAETRALQTALKEITAAMGSMQAAEADVYDLADAYEALGHESTTVVTTAQQIGAAMKGESAALNQVETASARASSVARTASSAQDQLGAAARRASGQIDATADSTRTARAGFVDIARATQDFAQGGFPAIVNNLEGVGRGLTSMLSNPMALLGSFPALLTIAGVAVLTFGGKVAEAAKGVYDVLRPDRIKDFASEIDTLKQQIKTLEENPGRLAIDTRDLDEAQKKLKRLEADKAAFDASQNQQTEGQAESGKNVKKALTEAGLPEITRDLKAQILKQFEAQSDVLKETQAGVAEAREGYARDQLTGQRVFVGKGSQIAQNYEAINVERGAKERQELARRAGIEAGRIVRETTEGNVGQAPARNQLVQGLRNSGREGLANQIAGMTPEAVARARAAKEKHDTDQAVDEATANATRDQEARQKKEDAAKDKALDAHLRGIYREIEANDANQKAEAAVKKKANDAEVKVLTEELEAGIKATEKRKKAEAEEAKKRDEAEADRIKEAAGKDAPNVFRQQVQANPMANPEEIALRVASELANGFRRLGATQGGAGLAAQQLAGQAGFRLTTQQITAGQFALGMPGQAPAVQRFAKRAKKKRVVGPLPNTALKQPNVPPSIARPKLQQPASEAEVLKRREAERKAKAAPQAPPVNLATFVPAVSATQDAISATQAATQAALAAIAQLNARAHQQRRLGQQLANLAAESGHSASNTGSSVQ